MDKIQEEIYQEEFERQCQLTKEEYIGEWLFEGWSREEAERAWNRLLKKANQIALGYNIVLPHDAENVVFRKIWF